MNDFLRRLTTVTYAIALFFMISPVVDIITNAIPIHLANEQWRFSFASVASNYLVSLMFGATLWALLAAATSSRLMLRVMGVLSIAFAIFLLVLLGDLVLDSLQLSSIVRPEETTLFRIGAAKAGMKIAFALVVFILLFISSFRAAKTIPAPRAADRTPLVAR